jgi:hypothetical protein
MNTSQNNVGWGFWLEWVRASVIGFGVGAFVGFVIPIYANFNNPVVFAISFGTVLGAAGGLAQWLVLRKWITGINLWAPASALGFAIATGMAVSMDQQAASNSNTFAFLLAAVFGVTGGLMQWLILRKHGVTVGWWLAANLLGSLLGIALATPSIAALGSGNRYPSALFILILLWFGAALGVGLGVTTGGALVWLLRHPKSGPRKEAATQDAR